jgi:hypothetical protein
MGFAHWFSSRRPQPRRRKPAPRRFDSLEKRLLLTSAPVIDTLYAVVGSGNTVSISGHVSDFDPSAGPINVALSGPVAANLNVDASGMFSYFGPAAQLGVEQAVAFDSGTGLSSDPFSSPIENAGPTIDNFTVYPTGDGKNVLLSGSVQDESPEGLTVSFSGVVSGSTTTDASGNFSLVALASELGDVTASASDAWGAVSAPVTAALENPAPVVQLDQPQTDMTGTVTVSGFVSDLSAGGATVDVSGVVNGTVTADANGYFSLTAPSSGPGTVTATATNGWNQTSSPTEATVDPMMENAVPMQIVNLIATYVDGGKWLITGTVQGGDLSTATVSYSGTESGSASVDSSTGNFSFEVQTSEEMLYSGWANVVASAGNGGQSDTQFISFGMA